MPRHFLEVDALDPKALAWILDAAEDPSPPPTLAGKGAALVFEKPSARTRNSSEMAVVQLGGHPVYIQGSEVGMGERESVADVARTLACYHAVIGARVYAHATVEGLAAASPVPVVNLLSDLAHPCQAVADLLTLRQQWGALEGRTIAYVGDANNVLRSLAIACALAGVAVRVATPPGYAVAEVDAELITSLGGSLFTTHRAHEAAAGADALYTDVWTSMGQEDEAAARRTAFEGFTIDDSVMAEAAPDAVFLHCLPAHRGEEVSDSVLEGPSSVVWRQAQNRMHAMRGILRWVLEDQ